MGDGAGHGCPARVAAWMRQDDRIRGYGYPGLL